MKCAGFLRADGHDHMLMRSRLRTVGLFGLLLLVVLAARLYHLQVVQAQYYNGKALNNSVVLEPIPAPRGRLLDRKGEILVSNAPQFELVVVPAEMKDRVKTVEILSQFLAEKPEVLEEKIRKAAPWLPLVLRRDLDLRQLTKATELSELRSGVAVRTGSIRRYQHGKLASHLFGFVSEINAEELRTRRSRGYAMGDHIGKLGLEKQYDELLRGTKGVRQVHIDVLGRTVTEAEIRPPTPGPDLYLTLDLKTQKVAEAALWETLQGLAVTNQERSGGAVVVLEAKTGAVLAMTSLPQYDPKAFSRGITNKEYQALLDDPGYPLVNRLMHSSFSPGSVFKLVTGTAGLQGGYCRPGSHFYCGGSFGGANCFARAGHGGIDFESAVAYSCNVVFYQLATQMGIDRLHKFCADYGLGSPTGIDLPGETGGLLPEPAWKERVWEDRWYEGDTINLSIGQGFLLVSPLQMAVVTAAVANGGTVVQPYLAEQALARSSAVKFVAQPKHRELGIKEEYLAAMRRGMRSAVTHGTSTAVLLPQVAVGGKTGTIENAPSLSNPKGRNHAWFVSFAPVEDPQVVVVVFLEKSGGFGGSLAAPIARKVYEHLFPAAKEPKASLL